MPREIVVDTNVMSDRVFLHWLREYHGAKYIPAIVYSEAALHSVQKGRSATVFHNYVTKDLGLIFERMDHRHAWRAAELAFHEKGAWGDDQARDYMIAGHVAQTGRLLITKNLKDFTCLGEAVMAPEQAMR